MGLLLEVWDTSVLKRWFRDFLRFKLCMVLNFGLWENAWCGHANIVLVKKLT